MKCELCHHEKPESQPRLCNDCADAVRRLIGIQQSVPAPEKPKAQKVMWNAARAGGIGE